MARYQHLPIYKLTYELLGRRQSATKDFPREYKFTIGQNLQNEVIELVVLIYRANSTMEKAPVIDHLLERVQVIELLIRLSHDMRILSQKNYAALVEMTESIAKQSQGWRRSVQKK